MGRQSLRYKELVSYLDVLWYLVSMKIVDRYVEYQRTKLSGSTLYITPPVHGTSCMWNHSV